jgi:hypothetical protein
MPQGRRDPEINQQNRINRDEQDNQDKAKPQRHDKQFLSILNILYIPVKKSSGFICVCAEVPL